MTSSTETLESAWNAVDRDFTDAKVGECVVPCDTAVAKTSGGWSVAEVKKIIKKNNPEVIERLCRDGVKVIEFDTAYDKWKYAADGREEETELHGLLGNTLKEKKEIRVRKELSNEEAAATLFHELGHVKRPKATTTEEGLQEEIDIRVETENFRIAQKMPETSKGYRKDGVVDRAFIEKQIKSSSHYNPVGRRRIGRRYVGENPTSGWCPP